MLRVKNQLIDFMKKDYVFISKTENFDCLYMVCEELIVPENSLIYEEG